MTERDFVFHFSLADVPQRDRLHDDAATELVRQQLLNLLDVAIIHTESGPVRVTGFALVGRPDRVFDLCGTQPRDSQ